ncbi:alpha/beta hydrolase [Bacillus tianshenii]|nr:alpha/beta hydrolase [Bacillus tianshenii]
MSVYYEIHQSHPSHEWICFFHGLGGSHRMFSKQIESFRDQYNLLLFDLPGHGASEGQAEYSPVTLASTVLTLMNKLNIKKAHLLGVSLGTMVIQEICYAAPERVLSVINGGTAVSLRRWGKILSKLVFAPFSKVVIPYLWNYKTLAYLLMPKNNHKRSRHFFIQEAKKMNKEDYFKWCDFLLQFVVRYKKMYKEFQFHIPQLHIMGSEDHMFLKGVRRYFHEKDIRIIEKCGHVCNIEKHKEFNRHVLEFLKEQHEKKSKLLTKVN